MTHDAHSYHLTGDELTELRTMIREREAAREKSRPTLELLKVEEAIRAARAAEKQVKAVIEELATYPATRSCWKPAPGTLRSAADVIEILVQQYCDTGTTRIIGQDWKRLVLELRDNAAYLAKQ